ncbi:MAG TPA: TolC family protein [Firmicutes bacterium]|nr:TolC family protein [Bacillota bacterium]
MHKKIMKIIAAGLVAALLCFAAPAVADQAAPLQLTLPAAIELALERSLDLQKAELELDAAELAQRQAKSAADDLPSQLAVSYDLKKVKEVYPYQARVMAETAKGGVAQAKEGVRYGVTAAYYGVLRAEQAVTLAETALARANEQLRLAELHFQAGMVAKTDVLEAQVQQANAQAALLQAQRGAEMARLGLNKALGLDLDTEIALTDELRPLELPEVDLDKIMALAMERRMDVLAARAAAESADREADLARRCYGEGTYVSKSALIAAEKAALGLQQAERDATLAVRQAYLDVLNAHDQLAIGEKALASASESMRLANLRYREGMATSFEVLSVQTLLAQAENQALQNLFNYNLAVAGLRLAVGGEY